MCIIVKGDCKRVWLLQVISMDERIYDFNMHAMCMWGIVKDDCKCVRMLHVIVDEIIHDFNMDTIASG